MQIKVGARTVDLKLRTDPNLEETNLFRKNSEKERPGYKKFGAKTKPNQLEGEFQQIQKRRTCCEHAFAEVRDGSRTEQRAELHAGAGAADRNRSKSEKVMPFEKKQPQTVFWHADIRNR